MDDLDLSTPLLLFDHECQLCVRFKDSLMRVSLDEKINAVSLHEPEVYKKYPFLNKDACLETIHLVLGERPEDVLIGEKAIEYLISLNPQVQKFTWLIESKMGQKALNLFYHAVNNYRESLLNRCTGCRNRS